MLPIVHVGAVLPVASLVCCNGVKLHQKENIHLLVPICDNQVLPVDLVTFLPIGYFSNPRAGLFTAARLSLPRIIVNFESSQ